jgi:hypothetical protein
MAAEYAALPEDSDHDYELQDGHHHVCQPASPGTSAPSSGWWSSCVADTGAPGRTACHLGGPFGYVDEPPITGFFTTQHPFSARVDIGALT